MKILEQVGQMSICVLLLLAITGAVPPWGEWFVIGVAGFGVVYGLLGTALDTLRWLSRKQEK